MNAPVAEVQREISICGLARMRARRLQNLLRTIKEQQGKLSLAFLADKTVDEGFDYLMAFYGIGPKTAAFTLLFGLGHPILPVDNGVLRVVRRLRLVRAKARDLEAEQTLSPLIPAGSHYPMHVLSFRHAKERCRPKNPKCPECALLKLCPHGQRRTKGRADAVAKVEAVERTKRLAKFVSAGIGKYADANDED
jgi:endonuclease-3